MRELRGQREGTVEGGGSWTAGLLSVPPQGQAPGAGAPLEAGGPALSPREPAHGVLAGAALDVGVAVLPGAAVGAAQLYLPLAGTPLLAAGALVIQGLGLGRVPGAREGQGEEPLPGRGAPSLPPPPPPGLGLT